MYRGLARVIRDRVDVANARILDYGCGPGFLSRELVQRGTLEIAGVDNNREAVEQFNKAVWQQGIPPSEMRAVHTDELDHLRNFDIIIVSLVLHHISPDSQIETLLNLKRHLESTGVLIILENERSMTSSAVEHILEKTGFTNLSIENSIRIHPEQGRSSFLIVGKASA